MIPLEDDPVDMDEEDEEDDEEEEEEEEEEPPRKRARVDGATPLAPLMRWVFVGRDPFAWRPPLVAATAPALAPVPNGIVEVAEGRDARAIESSISLEEEEDEEDDDMMGRRRRTPLGVVAVVVDLSALPMDIAHRTDAALRTADEAYSTNGDDDGNPFLEPVRTLLQRHPTWAAAAVRAYRCRHEADLPRFGTGCILRFYADTYTLRSLAGA